MTSATECWWCGESVFFHTNGNGDCVLFDSKGWPWPIHPCWQNHRDETQRRGGLRQLETQLEHRGYDGTTFSFPYDTPIPDEDDDIDLVEYKRVMTNQYVRSRFEDDSSKRFVRVAGFLSQKTGTGLELSLDGSCEEWCEIEITTTDSTRYFFVPRQVSDSLSKFALIRIAGRWCKIRGDYFLIGTRIDSPETLGRGVGPTPCKNRQKVPLPLLWPTGDCQCSSADQRQLGSGVRRLLQISRQP